MVGGSFYPIKVDKSDVEGTLRSDAKSCAKRHVGLGLVQHTPAVTCGAALYDGAQVNSKTGTRTSSDLYITVLCLLG